MKKIISINLSGRVIPIEDTAYERLQHYIDSLRSYFAGEEGRDEIINDIESRVAELMNDKVKKGAAAIKDADIEEIINSMGRIEDFEEVVSEGAPGTSFSGEEQQSSRKRFSGRLYRDGSDKILGGVCAGIANYMNVDPAVVRLLFAIITFGGFGFGVLIYILLWIILPEQRLQTFSGKRFYRNPDDRILAGVAGGLAAYFNKPAWAIRLIFAAPLLMNILFGMLNGIFFSIDRGFFYFPNIFFGSFTGTFIITYIVLWIVMPLADTEYEKMEMRGEKVDVNRIRQNVQEGMNEFRNRMQSWGEEVKTSAQNLGKRAGDFAGSRSSAMASDISGTTRRSGGVGYVLGVLFKAFFLFIAGVIAFSLLVILIVMSFGGGAAFWPAKKHIMDFALDGFWQYAFFWGTVAFFFVVPVAAFITWVVRRIMRVHSRRHYLAYVFAGLWFIGLICMAGLASSLAHDFRRQDRVVMEVGQSQPAGDRLIVRVPQERISYSGDMWFFEDVNFDVDADSMRYPHIRMQIIRSEDTSYSVTAYQYSRGKTRREARLRAERISYPVELRDSQLLLGSALAIDKKSLYRGQRVTIVISVPAGKMIRFDESLSSIYRTDHRRERRRSGRFVDIGWDEDNLDWNTNVDYIMSESGTLVRAGGNQAAERGNFSNDSLRMRRMEQRRIRDSINSEIRKTESQMRQRTGIRVPKQQHDRFSQMPRLGVLI